MKPILEFEQPSTKDELLRSVNEEARDIARECQQVIEELDQLMREFGFNPADYK